jgi:hypothetical protein
MWPTKSIVLKKKSRDSGLCSDPFKKWDPWILNQQYQQNDLGFTGHGLHPNGDRVTFPSVFVPYHDIAFIPSGRWVGSLVFLLVKVFWITSKYEDLYEFRDQSWGEMLACPSYVRFLGIRIRMGNNLLNFKYD